jgi:hypothetical protein
MPITSYPKSSSLAKPIASSSKPLSKVRQAIEPQSQAHADTLARHGIKVRDFAYESNLPAVRPYYRRQVQPEPPSLKRVITDDEDNVEDQNGAQPVASGFKKKGKLKRELTEPDIQESSLMTVPIRDQVITNILDHSTMQNSQSSSNNSQQNEWPSSQPLLSHFSSQPSEPVTPLVTPNGSLHWVVGESSPNPVSQLDTATSRLSISEGINPVKIPLQFSKDPTGLLGPLSPMSSLASIPGASPAPLAISKGREPPAHPRNSKEAPVRSSPPRPTPPLHGSTRTSRYHLRRRSVPKPPSHTASTKQTRCPRHTAPRPSPRPLVHSIQSSHSRTKPSSGSGSSGTRPLRKRQRIAA